MAEEDERRRRPDPERDRPHRNFSGAFGVDPWSRRDEVWRERYGNSPEPGNRTGYREDWRNGAAEPRNGNSPAAEGVRVGYDILQEHMRDGQRAAEFYNGGHREDEMNYRHQHYHGGFPRYSWGPRPRAGAAWGPAVSELVSAMQSAFCASLMPGLHARFSGSDWYAPPEYCPPSYCPPTDDYYPGGFGKDKVIVKLDVQADISVHVNLQLQRYLPTITVDSLKNADQGIKDQLNVQVVALQSHTEIKVVVKGQPAGTYVGELVDRTDKSRKLGTLTVYLG